MENSGEVNLGDAGKENTMNLRVVIQELLNELVPPDSVFPLSHDPISVEIQRVDEEEGTADIYLGKCRLSEGMYFGRWLKGELESRIPQLRKVSISMSEI